MKENYVLDTEVGNSFDEVAAIAKKMATSFITSNEVTPDGIMGTRNVEFDFNGKKVIVAHDTNLEHLSRDFSTAWVLNWDTIGPHPVEKYNQATEEAILEAKLKQRREQEELEKQWKLEAEEKKNAVKALMGDEKFEFAPIDVEWKTKDNPTPKFIPAEQAFNDWKVAQNGDGYGLACFTYAERWALLLQAAIKNEQEKMKALNLDDDQKEGLINSVIRNHAEKASHDADIEGITGFMYGMAVNILTQCWKYGEVLRKWHNKEYNHEGEGVVNPAILTIGK